MSVHVKKEKEHFCMFRTKQICVQKHGPDQKIDWAEMSLKSSPVSWFLVQTSPMSSTKSGSLVSFDPKKKFHLVSRPDQGKKPDLSSVSSKKIFSKNNFII